MTTANEGYPSLIGQIDLPLLFIGSLGLQGSDLLPLNLLSLESHQNSTDCFVANKWCYFTIT